MKKLLILLGAVTLVVGCSTASNPTVSGNARARNDQMPGKNAMPVPSVSEHVKTEGGGFLIDRNRKITIYAMTYSLRKKYDSEIVAKVKFENPERNGNPIETEVIIPAGETTIMARSPHLQCILNHKNYDVSLKIYSLGKLLATQNDQVRFEVPDNMLGEIGIPACQASSPKLHIMTTADQKLASDAVSYLQDQIGIQGCEIIESIKTTPLVLGANNNIEYWEVSGCGRVFKYELTFATNGSTFSAKQRN